MPNRFYLIEQALERIKALERTLALHKLDPRTDIDLADAASRKRVHELIEDLDALLAEPERDPRFLRLLTDVQGLRDFLQLLQDALAGSPAYAEWLKRQRKPKTVAEVNKAIDRIIAGLDGWARLAEEKVHAHLRQEPAPNAYLDALPAPPDKNHFYAMVKELSPLQTVTLHPLDPRQAAVQRQRSTAELLRYDPEDPIAGSRFWREGDSQNWPGSGIRIVNGHHRVYELYRRYLHGEIPGDTLVLLKVDYGR